MNNGHIQPQVCLGPNQVLNMVTKMNIMILRPTLQRKNTYLYLYCYTQSCYITSCCLLYRPTVVGDVMYFDIDSYLKTW